MNIKTAKLQNTFTPFNLIISIEDVVDLGIVSELINVTQADHCEGGELHNLADALRTALNNHLGK